MKKIIYALILALVVASGVVFANCEIKNETAKKPISKTLSAAEKKAELKKWQASSDGIKVKKWKMSPKGKKVITDATKISKHISAFTDLEAVITCLSLPPGSLLGYGVMARINGEDYILTFEPEKSQLKQLNSLKVNDKIILKSQSVSYAPKYSYPIVSVDYIQLGSKVIYKRTPRKGGC